MKISRKSPVSMQWNTLELDVTQQQIDRWKSGELIQNVMPQLQAHEREFIKTGITEEEWDSLIPEE